MTTNKIIISGIVFLIILVVIIRLFNFFKPNLEIGQFVNEEEFKSNCDNQIQMTPNTLSQLREQNVYSDTELKLEYFFYTNSINKAIHLTTEIMKLNYSVDYKVSSSNPKLFIISGFTTKIKMSDENVKIWVKQMCELGYKFDCEFDGWGTDLEQD